MTLTRRGFLASLGLAVTAVTFQGPTGLLEPAAATLDDPLRVGDLITVAGRYAVNPITRQVSDQAAMVRGHERRARAHWPASVGAPAMIGEWTPRRFIVNPTMRRQVSVSDPQVGISIRFVRQYDIHARFVDTEILDLQRRYNALVSALVEQPAYRRLPWWTRLGFWLYWHLYDRCRDRDDC